jgi:transcriptional regulator with XRE-family HTH domain
MTKSLYTGRHERLCKLLIEAREKRGLTQIDVSKKLGRPQSFVSKYENGERRLDVIEFLEVADALGIEPSRFINQLRKS